MDDLINTIINGILTNNGISIGLDGTKPNIGYMVAISKDYEAMINNDSPLSLVIRAYLTRHLNALKRPNVYFGAWLDRGTLYLDLSERVLNKRQALDLGLKRNQLAIYDLNTNTTINLR